MYVLFLLLTNTLRASTGGLLLHMHVLNKVQPVGMQADLRAKQASQERAFETSPQSETAATSDEQQQCVSIRLFLSNSTSLQGASHACTDHMVFASSLLQRDVGQERPRRCGSTYNHSHVERIASSNVHTTREIPYSHLLEVETEIAQFWRVATSCSFGPSPPCL